MNMTPIQTVYCQRCGQPNGVLYDAKVPTRGAKRGFVLGGVFGGVGMFLFGVWHASRSESLSHNATYLGVVLLLSVGFVVGSIVWALALRRRRAAQVVVCNACRACYVVTPPPSDIKGWDSEKLEREVLGC